jgi:ABC-type Mn2+/Zn2+ transport system permease subunit
VNVRGNPGTLGFLCPHQCSEHALSLSVCGPELGDGLGELLFGDLLGVTAGDLVEAAVLAVAVVVALALTHRPLALSAFDRAAAPSLGARPGRWELVMLALLAICIVAAVRGLGNLLVVALILAPAAAALNLVGRLGPALALAALLAGLSGVLGLLASYQWEVAAGASVALAAVLVFVVSLLTPTRLLRVP